MTQVTYTNINETKRGGRLWIEGVKVEASGFTKGLKYSIRETEDSLMLLRDNLGTHTVSGRTRNGVQVPIIDLVNKKVVDKFGMLGRVKVLFMDKLIVIRKHHEAKAQEEREAQIIQNVKSGKVSKATVCVGGGVSATALYEAAQSVGIKSGMAWVVDLDLRYLQSAYLNSPAIDDNTDFLVGKVEEIEDEYYTNIDVLSVSLPCSGFASAGKVKHGKTSIEHESSTSLFGLVRSIRLGNPAVIVSENVVEAKDSAIYQMLEAELVRTGYTLHHKVLEPEDTPTFEKRRRYWFVAISNGLNLGFNFELPGFTPKDVLLAELMDETIAAEMWCENEYLKSKAITDKKAGKNFARQLLTGASKTCGTIGRHYAKKRSTEPFVVREEDTKERLLTKTEHARVKSVPEFLVNGVPTTTAHQILGQGIDYLQGLFIGKIIFKHLKEISNA